MARRAQRKSRCSDPPSLAITASAIASFSAAVRARLGVAMDSRDGSIGSSRFEKGGSHPASAKENARTGANFRMLHTDVELGPAGGSGALSAGEKDFLLSSHLADSHSLGVS